MKFNPLHLIYLPRAAAVAYGMTHEGRLYGVPAWLAVGTQPNELFGAPKVPMLQLWCLLADAVLEATTYFMPADRAIETPVTILKPIGDA